MASASLLSLLAGIEEVRDLQRANPTPPGGLPDRPRVVRAINRASVVLLSSHLERFLRSLNEEAVGIVNTSTITGAMLPEELRLQHSQVPIEELAATQWDRRALKLSQLVTTEGWLWGMTAKENLEHDRLLRWMKSPSPERAKRMFKIWGVADIFAEITRQPHTKVRMELKLKELVDKRNDIAHGDAGAEATYQDIATYLSVVKDFCSRSDRALAKALARYCGGIRPW